MADAKTNPLRAKKMYVLAALLVSLQTRIILSIPALPTGVGQVAQLISYVIVRYRYYVLPFFNVIVRYRCCALHVGGKLP